METSGKKAHPVEKFPAARAQVELSQREAHDKSIEGG
jgi:hypothetical protein